MAEMGGARRTSKTRGRRYATTAPPGTQLHNKKDYWATNPPPKPLEVQLQEPTHGPRFDHATDFLTTRHRQTALQCLRPRPSRRTSRTPPGALPEEPRAASAQLTSFRRSLPARSHHHTPTRQTKHRTTIKQPFPVSRESVCPPRRDRKGGGASPSYAHLRAIVTRATHHAPTPSLPLRQARRDKKMARGGHREHHPDG